MLCGVKQMSNSICTLSVHQQMRWPLKSALNM
jgi:hypothetical protein